MPPTLESLERRLAAVEGELVALRQRGKGSPELVNAVHGSQALLSEAVAQAFAAMGLASAEPMSQEELRALLATAPAPSENNAFRREIQAMRTE